MNKKDINILITNDDGIFAEGLMALKTALDQIGTVYVVAPDRERSACGHSVTLREPILCNCVKLPDGSKGYSITGTPADCVYIGTHDIVDAKIDLVVSGINRGSNLGWDVQYSGTVSAAMEAVMAGIPSIAISLTSYDMDVSFQYAADFAAYLGRIVLEHKLPQDTLLNVNVPNLPADRIRGIEITTQGRKRYNSRVDKRIAPNGCAYYWICGTERTEDIPDGTDVKAIANDKVSITPIHLNLTNDTAISLISKWGIEEYNSPRYL